MPPVSPPIELRLNRARILFRHWQQRAFDEGYVREFSPDGTHVRISRTPKTRDKGEWFKAADYRCGEVLEANFDFKAWNLKERARKQREREADIGGEDWKHRDADDDDDGEGGLT